jgi:hypothetical protein
MLRESGVWHFFGRWSAEGGKEKPRAGMAAMHFKQGLGFISRGCLQTSDMFVYLKTKQRNNVGQITKKGCREERVFV